MIWYTIFFKLFFKRGREIGVSFYNFKQVVFKVWIWGFCNIDCYSFGTSEIKR